jgi:Anthranilate/para-aminobenzoate synthases component I
MIEFEANIVRQKMNEAGKRRSSFLFGLDFEMTKGFFYEDPMNNQSVLFTIDKKSNHSYLPTNNDIMPQLLKRPENYQNYLSKYRIARSALQKGNSFLLNLTERTPVECNLTLNEIYSRTQALYKILVPEQFVCFSPESFVQIISGKISSYPMKGTIDASLPHAKDTLMQDYKETCEHNTIVDLIRNDLSIVANKVHVRRFRYVDTLKTNQKELLQTSSEICGTLPNNYHERLGNIIFDMLPAGSVSGAPKQSTVRTIREAEKINRGYYSGVFGYYDGETLDSAVMIRYIEKEKGNYYFRSGGGITINSKPEEEYQEVLDKIYLPL